MKKLVVSDLKSAIEHASHSPVPEVGWNLFVACKTRLVFLALSLSVEMVSASSLASSSAAFPSSAARFKALEPASLAILPQLFHESHTFEFDLCYLLLRNVLFNILCIRKL